MRSLKLGPNAKLSITVPLSLQGNVVNLKTLLKDAPEFKITDEQYEFAKHAIADMVKAGLVVLDGSFSSPKVAEVKAPEMKKQEAPKVEAPAPILETPKEEVAVTPPEVIAEQGKGRRRGQQA